LAFRFDQDARGTQIFRWDDEAYAVGTGRRRAMASLLLKGARMTSPRLRGTIAVLITGLSLAVLAPREAFAQG